MIGAGSMYPDVLREHIKKCRAATDKPFAVNVPLLVPGVEQYMQIIAEEKVPIVFTSAGNPKSWTGELKKRDIKGATRMPKLLFPFRHSFLIKLLFNNTPTRSQWCTW